jgi:branched-chain amino acid transport system permease protein
MFELIGVPPQALFGQLLLGLINGAFYALLSLGLAVIFGLMNVINFTHGAQYMMGAFCSWMLLQYLGIPFWGALVLAPIIVGITGIIIERLFISRLYHLDHLYGLLLTFGLALIIEGLFRQQYGSSGLPYTNPIQAALTWASCSCPGIAVHSRLLAGGVPRHLVRHREDQARLLPARGDGAA